MTYGKAIKKHTELSDERDEFDVYKPYKLSESDLSKLDRALQPFFVAKEKNGKTYKYLDTKSYLKSKGALNVHGRVTVFPPERGISTPYTYFVNAIEQWEKWRAKKNAGESARLEQYEELYQQSL